MKKRIVVATQKPFTDDAREAVEGIFEEAGYYVDFLEKYTEKSELVSALAGAHGLIVRSDQVDAEVMDASDNLEIIVRAGAGYDNIDLDAATIRDILVENTPGQNSNAVAELVFAMILFLARERISGKAGRELRKKKIGIHGFGNVGKYVGLIAHGFGMDVHAYDPHADIVTMEAMNVRHVNLMRDFYSMCDYITVHLPLADETRRAVNYKNMSLMKEGAVLVNTARKEVVCEDGLQMMFNERPDFMYAADVPPDCRELLESKYEGRCFFTPRKMGAQTREANLNAAAMAAKHIVNYFEEGLQRFRVNRKKPERF